MQTGVAMSERGVSAPRPLTQDRLKEVFHYDPETGVFTRKWSRRTDKIGTTAGTIEKNGYVSISVDSKRYYGHRLAWLYIYDDWPDGDIDHIDRNRANNAISNLRAISHQANAYNARIHPRNRSGITGVALFRRKGRNPFWLARFSNKNVYSGADFFEACCARKSAENKFWQRN